jgi:hypothetical protein
MRHLQSINNMLRTLGISALFVFPALSASASQPYVEFSGISGNAGTISLSRVPIVLSNGQVIYKDVILLLQANASGVLSSSISQLNSPIFPAQPLQSGIYVDVSSTNYGFEMTGPGQLPNGVGKWIIRPVTGLAGNDCRAFKCQPACGEVERGEDNQHGVLLWRARQQHWCLRRSVLGRKLPYRCLAGREPSGVCPIYLQRRRSQHCGCTG